MQIVAMYVGDKILTKFHFLYGNTYRGLVLPSVQQIN